ncbi:MAG: Hsp70 family protein [Planctomycetes bacterium]|nr:Hsp70 family protein [Planctomycetota bacterium]
MADEKPAMTCGIDLGTTNSAIAFIDEHGKAQVIQNTDNERITPSVVLFEESEVLVGKIAKNSAVAAPDRVVQFVKRHMGEEGWVKNFFGKEYTPETISALILKRIVQDAETVSGGKVGSVVITVPAYFNEVERKGTQDAGIIAGLNVVSILNEPTAAALAYGLDRLGEKKRVLVYDLGGGTFDVTIIEIDGTKIDVLATDGERRLGGIDWDDEIINLVAEKFQAEHGIDPRSDVEACQDLRNKAEEAKMSLSKLDKVRILCQCKGKSTKVELSREEFEKITKGLLDQTETYLGVVLEKAKLSWKDIQTVLLVGGMTRMPAVVQMIQRVTGIKPETGINPDECVAMGAAYYNAVLALQAKPSEEPELALAGEVLKEAMDEEVMILLQGVEVTNVNSHSLGIVGIHKKTGKVVAHKMIPKNTPIPVEITKPFGTEKADQASVIIKIVEGESENPEDCTEIGTCEIKDLPKGRPAGSLIDVTYSYSVDGRLQVTGKDRISGKEARVEIVRSSGMDAKEIKDAQKDLVQVEVG